MPKHFYTLLIIPHKKKDSVKKFLATPRHFRLATTLLVALFCFLGYCAVDYDDQTRADGTFQPAPAHIHPARSRSTPSRGRSPSSSGSWPSSNRWMKRSARWRWIWPASPARHPGRKRACPGTGSRRGRPDAGGGNRRRQADQPQPAHGPVCWRMRPPASEALPSWNSCALSAPSPP